MGLDVLRKMLSKLLLLCRIFTVSGAVSLLFLPFTGFFFSSLENKVSKVFYSLVIVTVVTVSCSEKKKAHNSVPWFCVGFNLLLEMSCFLWVALLLQLELCYLTSMYLVFCQWAMELAHCAILVTSVGQPLQIIQRMIDFHFWTEAGF